MVVDSCDCGCVNLRLCFHNRILSAALVANNFDPGRSEWKAIPLPEKSFRPFCSFAAAWNKPMMSVSNAAGTHKRSVPCWFAHASSLRLVADVPGRQGCNSVQAKPGEAHLTRPCAAPKTMQPSSRLKHNAIVAG